MTRQWIGRKKGIDDKRPVTEASIPACAFFETRLFRYRPVAEIQHSTKQFRRDRGHWSTSAKSNAAAVAKIVDLTRRRDRLIPLGGG